MNKQEIINSLDAQINEIRYEETRFGDRKDYFEKDFEYAKMDEKIKGLHKVNVFLTWLLGLSVSIFLIFYLYRLFFTESANITSDSGPFVFTCIGFVSVMYHTRIALEKAKTIKYLLSLKEGLDKEYVV